MFDERAGINVVLGWVGIDVPVLARLDRTCRRPRLVIVTLWQAIGYGMIIFLAGLQDIPRAFYEAAPIDGAGPLGRFCTITLPLLKPTSVFVLVISIIGAPAVRSHLRDDAGRAGQRHEDGRLLHYQHAFQFFRFGYASALSVVAVRDSPRSHSPSYGSSAMTRITESRRRPPARAAAGARRPVGSHCTRSRSSPCWRARSCGWSRCP